MGSVGIRKELGDQFWVHSKKQTRRTSESEKIESAVGTTFSGKDWGICFVHDVMMGKERFEGILAFLLVNSRGGPTFRTRDLLVTNIEH